MTEKHGRLTVVTGPMKSGKTAYLLDVIRELNETGKGFQVYKPDVDTRSAEKIASRNGFAYPAVTLNAKWPAIPWDVFNHVNVNTVIIDEVQFFDITVFALILRLLENGVNVFVAGLDLDYATRPFITTARLMSYQPAMLVRCFGLCNCGAEAEFTQRLANSNERVMVGDAEYEPRCRTCYEPPAGVVFQTERVTVSGC
jgi:thymidine kinase